jgi:hypothetical protein
VGNAEGKCQARGMTARALLPPKNRRRRLPKFFRQAFPPATRFHRKIDSTAETAMKAAKQIDRFPFPRFLLSLAILDEKAPSRYSRHPRRPIA